jgi:hypothetical protein
MGLDIESKGDGCFSRPPDCQADKPDTSRGLSMRFNERASQFLIGCLLLTAMSFGSAGGPALAGQAREEPLKPPKVVRFDGNPLLRPEMIPKTDGEHSTDLNFPSLICVPDWIDKPLGKYYLYFSSHHGLYIRLAYADRVEGPWKIYGPGTLTMEQVEAINKEKPEKGRHTASPDVHVEQEKKEIRMYFHFKLPTLGHKTGVALSKDGLHFQPLPGALGEPYFRVFTWKKDYYAVDRRGDFLKSGDGLKDFGVVSSVVGDIARQREPPASVRHAGVLLEGDELSVFYTRVGAAPESIWMTRIHLSSAPKTWAAATAVKVLEPTLDYEGIRFPLGPSRRGEAQNVRQVRDPFAFREAGKTYLLYSVAGESGIALATLAP